MFDQHAAFRRELSRLERFRRNVDRHREQMTPEIGSTTSERDHLLQHVSVAFEDIPEDLHDSVRVMLMHPTEDRPLRDRVLDVVKNAAGGGWGEIEDVSRRLSCLHMLATLSIHVPYTYRVDDKVIRGSRPTPDKLRRLHAGGCQATINLCKEMPHGDDELIDAAGLTGKMTTGHIKIIDNTPPAPDQVTELFAHLASLAGPVYVHCEAGVGRTGVMVACYRMSRGWTQSDALHEARQFGCAVPDQLAFIENQASALTAALSSAAYRPADEVLRETAAMNKDPVGLERALTSATDPGP